MQIDLTQGSITRTMLRFTLAYLLSAIPAIGVTGIWWAVPIGWFLADAAGIAWYALKYNNRM